jgi:hypothetical protein
MKQNGRGAVPEAAGWLQQVVMCMLTVCTRHIGWRLVVGTSAWQCYVETVHPTICSV